MRKLLPIILLVAALGLGTWVGYKPKTVVPLGPSVRVDFIDVGQGDSIFIHTPDGANALIDAGESEYGEAVVAHLKQAGVRKLDLLVMSHPHSDHIGGMQAVLDAFPVSMVLDSGYAHGTRAHKHILEFIEEHKTPFRVARPGMNIILGKKTTLEVVGPPQPLLKNTDADTNNNSIVLRLGYGDHKMLFAGDIEAEGEGMLIASQRNIESQVLKVAHHGANDSTSLELLRLVRPEYVIMSVGKNNDYSHPGKRTLQRLAPERTGAQLLRTDLNGTITVRTDGKQIVVEGAR